ncbi:MAG: hypothetical protein JWP91_4024 [Fibrobacteres bacterium]|nr:hypothetical protein [Fibrobacterota bacterium]
MRVAFVLIAAMAWGAARAQETVDATTLTGKYMMGYQGWFWAPGDGSGDGWNEHWFRNSDPAAKDIVVDMYPDMRELDQDELFPTGLHMGDGSSAMLYSAYKEKTVLRHFKWMKEYQVDGVWVQRFLNYALSPAKAPRFNQVLKNCRKGAETYGRVFAVMYDLTGTNNANIGKLKADWMYLVDSLHVTESPRYINHHGKPLVSLWGIGMQDRPQPAQDSLMDIIKWFQTGAPARYRATVMGGTYENWRTVAEPFATTARAVDIISPWTIGRYNDTTEANNYKNVLVADMAEAKRLGKEYLPVVWPGFSWHNLFPTFQSNQIKRLGGKFYWTQVYNAVSSGSTMLYGAMFDEVNEGTAMFKVVPKRSMAPVEASWVALDADGYDLPSDWYLRLAGQAGKMLNKRIPLSKTMPMDPAHPDTAWTGVRESAAGKASDGRISMRHGNVFIALKRNGKGEATLRRVNGGIPKTRCCWER